jgi:hypothetical protein
MSGFEDTENMDDMPSLEKLLEREFPEGSESLDIHRYALGYGFNNPNEDPPTNFKTDAERNYFFKGQEERKLYDKKWDEYFNKNKHIKKEPPKSILNNKNPDISRIYNERKNSNNFNRKANSKVLEPYKYHPYYQKATPARKGFPARKGTIMPDVDDATIKGYGEIEEDYGKIEEDYGKIKKQLGGRKRKYKKTAKKGGKKKSRKQKKSRKVRR